MRQLRLKVGRWIYLSFSGMCGPAPQPSGRSTEEVMLKLEEVIDPWCPLTVNHCFHTLSSSLRQPLIYFLFLEIGLFQAFHLSGIMQCVVFCIWFLSPSITLLRPIYVVARVRTSFLFMVK